MVAQLLKEEIGKTFHEAFGLVYVSFKESPFSSSHHYCGESTLVLDAFNRVSFFSAFMLEESSRQVEKRRFLYRVGFFVLGRSVLLSRWESHM